jgi:general secretion pathway protein L
MLNQILIWWLRQMTGLVPARFRQSGTAPDAVIIAVDGSEGDFPPRGSILVRRDGAETFVAPLRAGETPRIPGKRLKTMLRLPEGAVLRREIVLPMAAEHDLDNVLGFEMDRLTPFQPDEVFWGVSALARDPARGLRVTLLIALRAPVEALLAGLAGLNLQPEFLETEAGRIPLRRQAAAPARRVQLAVYGLCGALAVACALIPVVRQQLAIADVQAQMAQLQPAVQEALTLRRQLSIAQSGSSAIAAAAQAGDMLQMLAALTAALPDGTFLTDFTLKSGDLTIDGQSSNAARLIGVLAAAPGFRDPTFSAPVTRAIDGQADLFSIHTLMAP